MEPPPIPTPPCIARRVGMWTVLLALLIGSGAAAAQGGPRAAEYQVKAAYLFKFIGYVEWPPAAFERADSPLVIGISGAEALADELAGVLAQRSVNGRPLVARKLRDREPLTGLHVLFVGADSAHAAELIALAKGRALLTITESETNFALGSAINFAIVDDKVRFDVALRPAELGNLKISARLLAVARRVIGAPS